MMSYYSLVGSDLTTSSTLASLFNEWKWYELLLVWIIINCLPMWIVISRSKKYVPTEEHRQNKKFRAFLRLDINEWSYIMTIFTHFFFIPRLIIGWCSIAVTLSGCLLFSIGLKKGEIAGKTRLTIYSWFLWFGSRIPLLIGGVIWIKQSKVEKCYKKWLGPDWRFDAEKSYKGAGLYVANH